MLTPQHGKSVPVSTALRPQGLQTAPGNSRRCQQGEKRGLQPVPDFRFLILSPPPPPPHSRILKPHSATGHPLSFPTALLTLHLLLLRGGGHGPCGLLGGPRSGSNPQRAPPPPRWNLQGFTCPSTFTPELWSPTLQSVTLESSPEPRKPFKARSGPTLARVLPSPETPDPCPSQKEGRLESAWSEPGWKTLLARVQPRARGPE